MDEEKLKAAGMVCHTFEECKEMYKNIPQEKKQAALDFLRLGIGHDRAAVKAEYDKDHDHWISPYHFGWGMGIRNMLRSGGFGEEYLGVHNLDDIYVFLIEEALDLAAK